MQSFPLRLPLSIKQQATDTARSEGLSLNHFIALAIAEKLTRMELTLNIRPQMRSVNQSPSAMNVQKLRFYS